MSTTQRPALTLSLVPSDEEQAIRASVRGICLGFGEDYPRRCHEAGGRRPSSGRRSSAAGFTGVNIPEEWGGGGLGMSGLTLVGEEIAAADRDDDAPARRLARDRRARSSRCHGTTEQKERWLRGIAAGTTKVAFAITEPDAGTNSHNLRTEVRRDGDRYLLRGQKTYISGVEDADAVLVVARLRPPDGELGLPTLCIVDVDAPGFTRDPIRLPYLGPDKQWTLFFDDVEVEPDRIVGGEEGGLAGHLRRAEPRAHHGRRRLPTALARRALEKACAYANERDGRGARRSAPTRAIAHPLARAKIELELARLMTQKAAALIDAARRRARGRGVEHGEVRRRRGRHPLRRRGDPDARRQRRRARVRPLRHVVDGAACCASPRSSEQMILNYVAEHSLGLPRSY